MLLPANEIARRRHRETRHVAIPLRVREYILTVVTLDDSWVLDAPRPVVGTLRGAIGKEHRRRPPREVQAIGALGEPDARRVMPDRRVARGVLGAVQNVHLTFPHNRGRIKRRELFPPYCAVVERRPD